MVLLLVAGVAFAASQDFIGSIAASAIPVTIDGPVPYSVQLAPGQTLRMTFNPAIEPSRIALLSDALRWSSPSDHSVSHKPIPHADFKAVHPGFASVNVTNHSTWQFGPLTLITNVIVRDRWQPYDLALSRGDFPGRWTPVGYALRVGDEVVVAYDGGDVLTTNQAVIRPTWLGGFGRPSDFHVLTATGAGTAQLALHGPDGFLLPITVHVADSLTRFDVMASAIDDGKTFHLGVGQSLGVALESIPGYEWWSLDRWDQQGLLYLIDPRGIGHLGQGAFGFQVIQAGSHEISFRARKLNCTGPGCLDGTTDKHVTLEISA